MRLEPGSVGDASPCPDGRQTPKRAVIRSAGFARTLKHQVTARGPGLRVVHEHAETVHGSATVCKRPDRP